MKKISFLAAIAIATGLCSTVSAQTVTLNVNLTAIQSISVNNASKIVDLDFAAAADYANGVTSVNADQLNVTSTGKFTVSVAATGDLTNTSAATIPIGKVWITTANGTTNPVGAGGGILTPVTQQALSTTATSVFKATGGTSAATIDVTYGTAANDDAFINKDVAGNPYTTTLTYTIAAL